ncbi:MAG: DUF4430 domain-containing protein [Solirubrobacterales bacterium]
MFSSKRRIGIAVACAAVVSMAVPGGSMAAVKVNLRVEGESRTLFERAVRANPEVLRSTLGENRGRYTCDVTGTGGPGRRAATPTSALAASGLKPGLNWYASFTDFLVESVSGEAPEGSRYWSLFVNGKSSELGGCQVALRNGDSVVWAVTDGSEPLLAFGSSGSSRSARVTVVVTDSLTGAPVEAANVGGRSTDARGRLTLLRPARGTLRVKATKPGSIRSNTVRISARRR